MIRAGMFAHLMGLCLLRSASLLVPCRERAGWFREWRSELWHVRRTCTPEAGICWTGEREVLFFCAGAFPDALFLRQDAGMRLLPSGLRLTPPMQSVVLLLALIAGSYGFARMTPGVRFQVSRSPYQETQSLMLIRDACCYGEGRPTIRAEQYWTWKQRQHSGFTSFGFYRVASELLSHGGKNEIRVSVAHASSNLFELLGVPLPILFAEHGEHPNLPEVILSDEAWRKQFRSDPHIAGHVVRVGSQDAVVSGVTSAGAWRLPGKADIWMLESDGAMRPADLGFVVGRANPKTHPDHWPFAQLQIQGQPHAFVCWPLAGRLGQPWNIFLLTVFVACLALPATTSLSLGEYPLTSPEPTRLSRLVRWSFLGTKVMLLLPSVLYVSLDAAYLGSRYTPITPEYIQIATSFSLCLFGLRWALRDQRQRCPVCLNRLKHPARVGEPSRNFLGWNGTELICVGGHGLLHVPEIPTSWFSTQRWQSLDASWQVLFTESGLILN